MSKFYEASQFQRFRSSAVEAVTVLHAPDYDHPNKARVVVRMASGAEINIRCKGFPEAYALMDDIERKASMGCEEPT